VTEPFIRPDSPVVETPVAETAVTIPEVPALLISVKVEKESQVDEDSKVEVPKVKTPEPVEQTAPAQLAPLCTTFVSDLNIPDGQVFPPGAEFVKSWVLRNNGERAWPEHTQLGFVAGERMGAAKRIHVGFVAPGAEVTVSTPEMKAPESEGRYVSYWRLFEAEDGLAFGSSVWVDIVVTEATAEHDSGPSLASSSVIMPGPLSAAAHTILHGASSVTTVSDDDALSVASSMSLIDAPSEFGSERAVPVRSNAADGDFVVLYDTASSDEE
jgi:next-to-BRCA1 protein 1